MRTVLVTGFEPFGGESVNPSQQVALALDGAVVNGHRVAGRVLPCVFETAPAALDRALAQTQPRLVFALGQCAGRFDLSFERVAINLADANIADNCGARPVDVPVIAGAPAAHFSALPLKAIVAALRAQDIPASLSLSAGSYVCNALFFALLQRGVRGTFIHLPLLPGQAVRRAGQPCLALATMIDGVTLAIETALALGDDPHRASGALD